ncbi:MAG: divergent PAP2 family protein [Alphaproteobacteria bacterium]|nr:divergent PAP2 family protein [Alphaproteobacteria bacterium]
MIYNTGFEAIISGLTAVLLAQMLKVFTFYFKTKEIDFEKMATTGGMPSSHSAGVSALTMSVGLIDGFDSLLFAVSAGYALVIMHDAAGLRHDAGEIARLVNQIIKDFYKSNIKTKSKQLKELLGHTPKEVVAGLFLGVIVALFVHYITFYC